MFGMQKHSQTDEYTYNISVYQYIHKTTMHYYINQTQLRLNINIVFIIY